MSTYNKIMKTFSCEVRSTLSKADTVGTKISVRLIESRQNSDFKKSGLGERISVVSFTVASRIQGAVYRSTFSYRFQSFSYPVHILSYRCRVDGSFSLKTISLCSKIFPL